MPRRALITGATGFVGGHLVDRLAAEGWRLRALVRATSDTGRLEAAGVERVTGDLRDEAALRRAVEGVDVVFHLAAVTGLRGEKDFEGANVAGTQSLVRALRSSGPRPERLVYLSSYAACGPSRPGHARPLEEAAAPLTAYGRTKLAGESIVREAEEDGVEVVVLRAPVVYGPGDHALLPYFRLVRLGVAPAPSGADRELHLIYVEDLARALARAAEGRPGTYPVAEPRVHAWSAIVAQMARVLGRRPVKLPIPPALVRSAASIVEAAGSLLGRSMVLNREKAEEMLAQSWVCDLSGAEGLLPAEEATPLETGISRTVEWYTRQGWL